ncbi:sulfatase family protein [Haloferula sargassicola]|uniref:Ulvan-active sulfatase n=1 Tax=Haloferula sargassicola TaxID=490096 RepID=A0ABP9UH09_9BACT
MRTFFLLLLLALGVRAAERPNFLLMVADDLTWSDLGFAGNTDVRTPHLDSLRKEGMWLTRMFTPATTCSPTRNALYTGLFPIRSGAYPNHAWVENGTRSVFTHLKEAGYRVALQNKEHVGPKASYPYEHIEGADDLTQTRAFVDRNADQPWFLVFASNDPHSPWTRGPKYDPARIKVPPYLHDNAQTRKQLARYYGEVSKLDQQVGDLLKLLDETQQADNTVVIFVSEQGSSFPYGGKWLLYDNGIRATTLVRWPGRVAPGSSSDVLLQYTDITPTVLSIAGIDPASISPGRPDSAEKLGFDGKDFTSILCGGNDPLHDFIYAQHTTVGIFGFSEPYPMRAVRDRRFKYIRNLVPENTYEINGIHRSQPLKSWKKDAANDPELQKKIDFLYHRPGEELYDLESDPLEQHNLAGDPEFATRKAKLSEALDAWMKQQGDRGMATEKEARHHQDSRFRK